MRRRVQKTRECLLRLAGPAIERKWRSRATPPELPDRDTELLRLVGEVVLDTCAWEMKDTDLLR
jgi:hypothetical protein